LLGFFPPGRFGAAADAASAADNLLAGHVAAYDAIHDARPDAVVTTNSASVSCYELDRLYTDVLQARHAGVDRDGLDEWIDERRRQHDLAVPAGPAGPGERVLRALARRSAPYGTAGRVAVRARPRRAVDAVYASRHPRTLDVVGIDYYDPVMARHARLPGHRTAGGRSWQPASDLWDDRVVPAGLGEYARASALPDLDVWVVENGLCNRVRRGRSFPRLDRWDRVQYLRANLSALVDAVDHGLPVSGYYHWTLADNYEWGSYEPRFGIHGVDRERGVKILDTDAMGFDSAGAFRRIVDGLRAGDRSVLDVPR